MEKRRYRVVTSIVSLIIIGIVLSTMTAPPAMADTVLYGPAEDSEDFDPDNDSVYNSTDNCLFVANSNQTDGDGDGFGAACECNDSNANINPAALEIPGNGIDENCDGLDHTAVGPLSLVGTYILPSGGSWSASDIKDDILVYGTYSPGQIIIVNISDKTAPTTIKTLSTAKNVHYAQIAGDYAYAAGSGGYFYVVYNISDPANAYIVRNVSTARSGVSFGAIRVEGNYIYFTDNNGTVIYNITNSTQKSNPEELGSTSDGACDADVDVSGDFMYGYKETDPFHPLNVTMNIFNITDKMNPTLKSTLIYTGAGGWPIHVQGDYAYVQNYGWNGSRPGSLIINVTNKTHPTTAGGLQSVGCITPMPVGDLLYCSGSSQLSIWNVSNKSMPALQRNISVGSANWHVTVDGDYAYITDGDIYIVYTGATDTSPPIITINSPLNATINDTTPTLNVTEVETHNDTMWYSIDGGANITGNTSGTLIYNDTMQTFSEGQHYITVYANDTAGRVNSTTVYFTVDITAPYNITLNYPENGSTINTTNIINFNWTSYDAISNMSSNLTIDGEVNVSYYPTNNGTPTNYTVTLSEGPHNWSVKTWDDADNSTTSDTYNFTIAIPPNITIISPQNDTYGTGLLEYNITVYEPLRSANVSINGTANNSMTNSTLYNYGWIGVNLTEGQHNATFYVEDLYGNKNSSIVYFSVNFSRPAISIVSPLNQSYNIDVSFNISITNDVNLNSANVSVGGQTHTLKNYTDRLNWGNDSITLGDGSYVATFYAFGATGQNNTATRGFTIDTTLPTINITSPLNTTYEFGSSITLTYSANENISWDWYILDNGSNTSFVNGSTNITPSVGSHNITIWANDTANNWGSDTEYFTVEDTPPNVNIISPENRSYATSSIWVNVTLDQDTGNVTAELDGATNNSLRNYSGNWNYEWIGIGDGAHNIRIYANDSTGNMNSSEVVYFTVDTTPPAVTIDFPANTTYSDNQTWFNATIVDATNGTIDTALVQVDGVNYSLTNSSGNLSYQNTTGLPDGSYNAQFFVNDSLGNMNDTEVVYFTVNISYVPPVPPTFEGGGVGGGGGKPSLFTQPFMTLTSPFMYDILQDRLLTDKQFYEAPPQLSATLITAYAYPVPSDVSSMVLGKPIMGLEGDVYEIAASKVLEEYTLANTIVISRGDIAVDSIAAVAYARSRHLPILLTSPEELPGATLNALESLNPAKIIIIGGPVAVSEEVKEELAGIATIERIAGETRYETAIELAENIVYPDVIVITDGNNPSNDAAMISALYNLPLIYVNSDEITRPTEKYLAEHMRAKILFVGVNEVVATDIERLMS